MTEIDISRVLIEGDTATIMGVKYQRVIETSNTTQKYGKHLLMNLHKNPQMICERHLRLLFVK